MQVIFTTGSDSRTYDCDVTFGVQPIGKTSAELDNSLAERYRGGRVYFALSNLMLPNADRAWMTTFLLSTTKVITVAGEATEVVNASDGRKNFKSLGGDGNAAYWDAKLEFLSRTTVVLAYSGFIGLRNYGVITP